LFRIESRRIVEEAGSIGTPVFLESCCIKDLTFQQRSFTLLNDSGDASYYRSEANS
jgi:hypothetical protein